MMHFKKNLLAEYKKHDSDETSSSSPASSPTLSSASSSTPDKDEPPKQSLASGQQGRYRVHSSNSISSPSRMRLSSNEHRAAVPVHKILPGQSPKVQIRDLNRYESSRGKRKIRMVGMPEARRRTPTPDSTTSRRALDMRSPSEGLTLELVPTKPCFLESSAASSSFVDQGTTPYSVRHVKRKPSPPHPPPPAPHDFNNMFQVGPPSRAMLHHHHHHQLQQQHPHAFTSFPNHLNQSLPSFYDSPNPLHINRHMIPIYNPSFPMQLPAMAPSPTPEHQMAEAPPTRTICFSNLTDIIVEQCDDDSQPQRSPRRQQGKSKKKFHGYSTPSRSSKSSSSSARSIASPSSAGQEASSPAPNPPKERRRRRQDNLVPDDCPLKRDEIVDLPIDEFNDLIEKGDFSEAEKAQFRDWRRKGKNRVAARKSREKRIIGIEQLKAARDKKARHLNNLDSELDNLEREKRNLRRAIEILEEMLGIPPPATTASSQ